MRWEYMTYRYRTYGIFGGKIDPSEITEALNRYGRQGWELVSTLDPKLVRGGSREFIMFLKRQLPPEP